MRSNRFGDLVAATVGLGIERTCAGCDQPDHLLCPTCRAELAGDPFVAWPAPCPPGLPVPVAIAAYDGAVRSILLAHKENGRLGLARPLGAALARAVAEASDDDLLVLVPVPSRRSTVRARGHDAMLRTARAAAHRLRVGGRSVHVLRALGATRVVRDQAGLSSDERRANLADALQVRAAHAARLAGATVVVVDDVITTGSTLAESARALIAADAHVTAVATVAATRRRGSRPAA